MSLNSSTSGFTLFGKGASSSIPSIMSRASPERGLSSCSHECCAGYQLIIYITLRFSSFSWQKVQCTFFLSRMCKYSWNHHEYFFYHTVMVAQVRCGIHSWEPHHTTPTTLASPQWKVKQALLIHYDVSFFLLPKKKVYDSRCFCVNSANLATILKETTFS